MNKVHRFVKFMVFHDFFMNLVATDCEQLNIDFCMAFTEIQVLVSIASPAVLLYSCALVHVMHNNYVHDCMVGLHHRIMYSC